MNTSQPVPKTPTLDIVFFDLDDTLYSTTEFALLARRNAVSAMIAAGLQIDIESGMAEMAEVVAEFSSNYSSHFSRLLDRLGPAARAGHNPAVLVAAGVVGYHRTKEGLTILPDVRDALEALQEAGVRLGVISAGLQVKQAEKLVRLDVLKYFEPLSIFFTDQVGVGKPNPKLYALACQRARVDPRRAMYVGDRPSHDTQPAGSIGMRTVLYTGASGKYGTPPESGTAASGMADHCISDMRALPRILHEVYGIGYGIAR